ncbi:hypothetical protein PAMP_018019 [Pampus punctatissimus]
MEFVLDVYEEVGYSSHDDKREQGKEEEETENTREGKGQDVGTRGEEEGDDEGEDKQSMVQVTEVLDMSALAVSNHSILSPNNHSQQLNQINHILN